MSEIILITGAAGGIGQCLCRELIQRDVQLVLADLDAKNLESLCASLGNRATAFPVDLCDENQVEALIDFIRQRFGRLDVLVNNAAIVKVGEYSKRTTASIRQELEINLIAPLLLTRHAIALLENSTNARVINTVSIAGIFPTAESPIYSASKFGLRGAMLSLAPELASRGIRVSCVLPSATDTAMLRHEAVSGGNVMQFMDPPQLPEAVVHNIMQMLEKPKLESAPKLRELWLTRLLMLFPNIQPRLLPLFHKWGERGLQRYLESLEARGLAKRKDGKWELTNQ